MRAYFRASIIPYTWINNSLYVALGLDVRYDEITDFGGKCDFYDGMHITTAIREFVEETGAPIDFDFETAIKVEDDHHVVFFLRTMPYVMTNYLQYISNREIKKGYVIPWSQFTSLLQGNKHDNHVLWDSLRKLITPSLINIQDAIIQYHNEPIPSLPSVIHVKERSIFHVTDMCPLAMNESNKRYDIVEQGIPISKDAFLASLATRPHYRQTIASN